MVAQLMSLWRQLATAIRRAPAGHPRFIGGANLVDAFTILTSHSPQGQKYWGAGDQRQKFE